MGECPHSDSPKNARVDSWVTVQAKSKDKSVDKPERTLIIVGYVQIRTPIMDRVADIV